MRRPSVVSGRSRLCGAMAASLIVALLVAVQVPARAAGPATATAVSAGVPSSSTLRHAHGVRDQTAAAAGPGLALFRACTRNVRTLASCVGLAAFQACGATFSKFLGCSRRAYGVVGTARKILAFRASAACPKALQHVLADYVCSSRVPPAPRSVFVTVTNNGVPLGAYTGPSTFYRFAGTYPAGMRLPVSCVALFGQSMSLGGRADAGWSRLTNGLFVPRVSLVLVPGQYTNTVPYC